MRQFLRKRALVAVLSGIALVGMSQPASAARQNPTFRAQVTPNGIGDLLIFAYWTADERDTLIAITNAFGLQNERYVHIKFHSADGARKLNFTICLGRGDVWTAAISSNGPEAADATLTVGNPGSCDDTLVEGSSLTRPPMHGGAGTSIGTDFGYITAYTMECHTVGCRLPDPDVNRDASTPPYGDDDGGDDTIMGTATLVSPSTGFSSSYNATSLIGFDALNQDASIHSEDNRGRAHQFFDMERCPAPDANDSDAAADAACLNLFDADTASEVSTSSARTDVANALASEGGVNKEILMGRYTASPYFDSTTDLILTFPTGDQPQDKEANYDEVSVFTFDEEKNYTFSTTTLERQVNICTFQNSGDAASASDMTEFSCNDETPAQILGGVNGFTGGWFRILNNNDSLEGGNIGDGSMVEFTSIRAIPDSDFPVIGLLFSFFQGGDGVFDQAYGIQWAAITGQGGIGDPRFCSDVKRVTGYKDCDAFDIASQYQPHWVPSLPPVESLMFADDTGTGRNRRSYSGGMIDGMLND